jgi:hypothetical protein
MRVQTGHLNLPDTLSLESLGPCWAMGPFAIGWNPCGRPNAEELLRFALEYERVNV